MNIREEASRCLLCYEPTCTTVCKQGQDPGRFVRAINFENIKGSVKFITQNQKKCILCGSCEKACIRPESSVGILNMIKHVFNTNTTTEISETNSYIEASKKIDLSIDFCGVHCDNPFFLSSSVVASNYEMCAKALDMGWAGIVFKTIGVIEPKEISPRFDTIGKEGTSFIGFRNLEQISDKPMNENFETLARLKKNYPSKIIVSSIMGTSDEEWALLAKKSEECGADIIECNFSCPHMSEHGLGSDVGQNPELVRHNTEVVKKHTTLPVLAKMTPNVGNMEIPARAAIEGGADGLAAINTIKSITRLNPNALVSNLSVMGKTAVSGYSGKAVLPIALRFIHDMATDQELKNIPISGMGGIESWYDAFSFIALGCSNLQITTAVMQYGYRIIDDLIDGLKIWMIEQGYFRVQDIVGIGLPHIVDASLLNRATIQYPVFDMETCVGCGRCYISCRDGGHQAISFVNKKPSLIQERCVGCHLCIHTCPVESLSAGVRYNS